ncbi:alpha/beta hydrolase [Alicyclobacillus sp. ALC3]|uniref:alpha/beta hydrolase n=1 Tax=Alicyclobacillus sp. ALC3 TaxID=2796143 RepID=UPI0023797A02|nr:hypothetical protein [Alicyclobacillus sp. ALC3]WDL95917.1 hypothetical protein JC200_16380 [Alicyclobacillus sp. ALC3]
MNIHMRQPAVTRGARLQEASAAVVMMHGRDRNVEDILSIADRIGLPSVHYVAPQAEAYSWYPGRFMDRLAVNESHLQSALECYNFHVHSLVSGGIPLHRLVLLGFSQGACVTAEYAIRHARRYGGVIIYTGALIGPDEGDWNYGGDFVGTPVFCGSSDVDGWIPEYRVHHTANLLQERGADVTTRIYPGMGHIVSDDEVAFARQLIEKIQTMPA